MEKQIITYHVFGVFCRIIPVLIKAHIQLVNTADHVLKFTDSCNKFLYIPTFRETWFKLAEQVEKVISRLRLNVLQLAFYVLIFRTAGTGIAAYYRPLGGEKSPYSPFSRCSVSIRTAPAPSPKRLR